MVGVHIVSVVVCPLFINFFIMEVGDIVKPTKESGFILASGSGWYSDAVVVSLSPFILKSREVDMTWFRTKKENFEVVGKIDHETFITCYCR